VIDPSNLDWMGDKNDCIDISEDDDMGPSAVQTLTDKLYKMEGIYMEVSGTMSNTDYALPTKEDAQLLEEIRKSNAGVTINWSAFGESPISC
jgi:hypothetical protein